MKKNFTLMLAGGLAVAAALFTGGCQNSVNRISNADPAMTPNYIQDKRFITDGFLKDRLQLTGINTARTLDGLLMIQLTAVNVRTGFFSQMWSGMTGENPYPIKYMITWLDANGMARDSVISTWQQTSVRPGEALHIRSVAPAPDCNDFIINLQEAN